MGECAAPIRGMLRNQANVRVAMGEVAGVDAERRELTLDRGETDRLRQPDRRLRRRRPRTSGTTSGAEPSFALKTLADAVALREQILSAFEEAERATRRRTCTAAPDVRGHRRRADRRRDRRASSRCSPATTWTAEFTRFDPAATRSCCSMPASACCPRSVRSCRRRRPASWASLGVEVLEGARATAIDADGVSFERGGGRRADRREDRDLGGGRARGAVRATRSPTATGAAQDRGGRLEVGPTGARQGTRRSR